MEDKNLKKYYDMMEKNLERQMLSKLDLKEVEDKIKYDYAATHQLKNKKDEVDPGQTKFAEIKSAMNIFYELGKTDSLGEKYDRREEYLIHMKKGEDFFPIGLTELYLRKETAGSEVKTELNEIKKKCAENDVEEIEIKALERIAKIKVKQKEEYEKEKRAQREGKEYKPKNSSKELDIAEKIRQLLKELNINID